MHYKGPITAQLITYWFQQGCKYVLTLKLLTNVNFIVLIILLISLCVIVQYKLCFCNWILMQVCVLSKSSIHPHPAWVHFHVPLGPNHIVLVGGHWDPSPGTESRVTGSQCSVGEQQCYKHAWTDSQRKALLTSPPPSAVSPGLCEVSVLQNCRQEETSSTKRGGAKVTKLSNS